MDQLLSQGIFFKFYIHMETFDFVIVGGGCSGLSAAMYGTRLGLKTLCLAELPGGLITTTHLVENWPGVKSISGPDLAMSLYEHAQVSGADIRNEIAEKLEKLPDVNGFPQFKVKTSSNEYVAKTLLIATGTKHKRLEIPGEREFENRGVSFCALCDGAFFKNKVVAVVGGGDSAAKEALFLSEHASKVYIIVRRDVLRAEPINGQRVNQNPKIEILFNSELEKILGSSNVEKVLFKPGKGKHSEKELEMQGVFMAIGHDAQTELAKQVGVELNEKNEINKARNIYPNPTTGGFHLSGKYFTEVYNDLGVVILMQTTNEIDLSNYPKGIYFVKVTDGEKTYTSKIVVE